MRTAQTKRRKQSSVAKHHRQDVTSARSHVSLKTNHKDGLVSGIGTNFSLPPLKPSASSPYKKGFGFATQELRRTMRQLTGNQSGTNEGIRGLPNTDIGSALNTFLDTCTLSTDADHWRLSHEQGNPSPTMTLHGCDAGMFAAEDPTNRYGEMVVSEIPWYHPPLKAALLRQRCCYPDDNEIFRKPNLKQMSTFSNCSDATISSHTSDVSKEKGEGGGAENNNNVVEGGDDNVHGKGKPASHVAQMRKKRGWGKPFLPHKAQQVVKENVVTHEKEQEEERRRKSLRVHRFRNRINQWCDTLMRVTEKEKFANDPAEQHERCMRRVRKEEEAMLLVIQLKRHKAIQDRERRRQNRAREAKQQVILRPTPECTSCHNNWRRLLSSWTTEGGGEEKVNVKERMITVSPQITMQSKTDICLTQNKNANSVFLEWMQRNISHGDGGGNGYNNNNNSNSKKEVEFNPVEELQRLFETIADHSLGSWIRAKLNSSNCIPKSSLYTSIPSGEGAVFPPDSSVYMKTNWVEYILRGDDLLGIKQMNQRLSEYVDLMEPSLMSRMQKSDERYSVLVSSSSSTTPSPPRSLLLFPLRLIFNVHGVREREIVVDAVSFIQLKCSPQQKSSPNDRRNNNHHHHPMNSCEKISSKQCKKWMSNCHQSEEKAVKAFHIHNTPSTISNDFIGDPPHPYEACIGYIIDVEDILQQSLWRVSTWKRFANEESEEVRRHILARVTVTLSIHAVISGYGQVNYTTQPPPVSSNEVRDIMRLSTVMHTDVMDVNPFLRSTQSILRSSLSKLPAPDIFLVAPTQRIYYAVDTQQMYLIAATALKETNEILLPSLQRMREQYRSLSGKLMKSIIPRTSPFVFSSAERDNASTQVSDLIQLFHLEADYSELLATLHKNECSIIQYNLYVEPYSEFLKKDKEMWGPLYLRTLRLSYAFCVLVLELGALPIPPKYHPFLGPVLKLVGCHGGQKELRFRIEEYLLELEERAKRVLMPLLLRKVSPERMQELNDAAEAVACGKCVASQIITSLAVPEDVLATGPKNVAMPSVLFNNTPSIAG